jgi:hypothetical protein
LQLTRSSSPLDLQDFAYEPDQKYKEGRFILEKEMIIEKPEGKRDTGRPRVEELPVRELLARV